MNAKRLSHARRMNAPTALAAAIATLLALCLLVAVAGSAWGGKLTCASGLLSQIIEAIGPSIDTASPFGF